MKLAILLVALVSTLGGYTQNKERNRYDINFSAQQIAGKLTESRSTFYEGLLYRQEVTFSLAVDKDKNSLSLFILPAGGGVLGESTRPQTFSVRTRNERMSIYSGRIQRIGNTQFLLDISTLPNGNYFLSIDGLQAGQEIPFSTY